MVGFDVFLLKTSPFWGDKFVSFSGGVMLHFAGLQNNWDIFEIGNFSWTSPDLEPPNLGYFFSCWLLGFKRMDHEVVKVGFKGTTNCLVFFLHCYIFTPWKISGGTPTNPPYKKRNMIWTKPPGNYVPAVNLQGCSTCFFFFWELFLDFLVFCGHEVRDPPFFSGWNNLAFWIPFCCKISWESCSENMSWTSAETSAKLTWQWKVDLLKMYSLHIIFPWPC